MKTKRTKKPRPKAVASCGRSPALAGIKKKLLAAADEWEAARAAWNSVGSHATAAVCNTAAAEFRALARQCQGSSKDQ